MRMRGRTAIVTAAVAVATVMATAAAATAATGTVATAAQGTGGLGLELSPTTGLVDGQSVEYEVSGLPDDPATQVEFLQCEGPVAAGTIVEDAAAGCASVHSFPTGGDAAVTGSIGVTEVYEIPGNPPAPRVCSAEPSGCWLVAWARPPAGEPLTHVASVALDFTPTPVILTGAGLGGPDRHVDVWLVGPPGAEVRLAQCVRHQDAPPGDAGCVDGPTVTLPAGGRTSVPMTLADELDVGGARWSCLLRPCEVAAVTTAGGGTLLGRADVPGGVPVVELSLDRTTQLASGAYIRATVLMRTGHLVLTQCLAAVLDGDLAPGLGCHDIAEVRAGPTPQEVAGYVFDQFPPEEGPSVVACADDPGGCVVVLGRPDGAQAAYVPIDFAGPASATVAPSTGLLDGATMTFEATGLSPGEDYILQRCHRGSNDWVGCTYLTDATPVTASPEGTVVADVTASQRLDEDSWTYCRDRCSIGLTVASQWSPEATAGYTMATGTVTGSPTTGLADGQRVTLTGADMMPTYDGRAIWVVETGEWGVAQCDRAIADDPTLLGLFTHCAPVTADGPLEVPGSTFSLGVEVRASLDRILGGTTDCTAAPEACVLAVGRMEVDGSVTLHTVPLAFGPGSPGERRE